MDGYGNCDKWQNEEFQENQCPEKMAEGGRHSLNIRVMRNTAATRRALCQETFHMMVAHCAAHRFTVSIIGCLPLVKGRDEFLHAVISSGFRVLDSLSSSSGG